MATGGAHSGNQNATLLALAAVACVVIFLTMRRQAVAGGGGVGSNTGSAEHTGIVTKTIEAVKELPSAVASYFSGSPDSVTAAIFGGDAGLAEAKRAEARIAQLGALAPNTPIYVIRPDHTVATPSAAALIGQWQAYVNALTTKNPLPLPDIGSGDTVAAHNALIAGATWTSTGGSGSPAALPPPR